jgi:hypothetical protein
LFFTQEWTPHILRFDFYTQSYFLPPLRRLWRKPGSNPELLRCSLVHPVVP